MNSLQPVIDEMQKRGYSTGHVAFKAGIPIENLENSLKGKRQMSLDEFLAVCKVLEITPKSYHLTLGSQEWNALQEKPNSIASGWYYIEETESTPMKKKNRRWQSIKRNRMLYAMLLPMFVLYIVYKYIPMFGLSIAFMDYKPLLGIRGSQWVGFRQFIRFFNSIDAFNVIRNTLLLSIYSIIFSFPMPIIFALLLNELKNEHVKRIVQTISYLPHFLSTVVVVGIVQSFLSPMFGPLSRIFRALNWQPVDFIAHPEYFRSIYIVSGLWQNLGWSSIIYLSALTSIDPTLYEAAMIDGAGRFKQMLHVTLPSIANVIIITLIMSLGGLLSVGFEKVLLLQNSFNYSVSNVISTHVYQRGLVKMSYSYGTAIDLFNSVVGLLLVSLVNFISKRVTDVGLW